MRAIYWAVIAMLSPAAVPAAEPNVRVIVSGEVAPGVYGRVDIGGRPPPPLVYAEPVIITPVATPAPPQPIYLHVPPGHAKKWSKHCRKYDACGVPVYFVKSKEYERKKPKKEKKE